VLGAIELRNVTYGYDPVRPALCNVSLIVRPGKSTLLGLLLRFANPDRGAILLDGRDIREATLDSLRAQVALVLQEPRSAMTSDTHVGSVTGR